MKIGDESLVFLVPTLFHDGFLEEMLLVAASGSKILIIFRSELSEHAPASSIHAANTNIFHVEFLHGQDFRDIPTSFTIRMQEQEKFRVRFPEFSLIFWLDGMHGIVKRGGIDARFPWMNDAHETIAIRIAGDFPPIEISDDLWHEFFQQRHVIRRIPDRSNGIG